MEEVILELIGGGDDVDKKKLNGVVKIKPHPQPLPEEGGEWLVVEMEGNVWGFIEDIDFVYIKE